MNSLMLPADYFCYEKELNAFYDDLKRKEEIERHSDQDPFLFFHEPENSCDCQGCIDDEERQNEEYERTGHIQTKRGKSCLRK